MGKGNLSGPRLKRIIERGGLFGKVVYEGSDRGRPGSYFSVSRGDYTVRVRWHVNPVAEGFGQRPSRISGVTVSTRGLFVLQYESAKYFPRVDESSSHAKTCVVVRLLDDVVDQFSRLPERMKQ